MRLQLVEHANKRFHEFKLVSNIRRNTISTSITASGCLIAAAALVLQTRAGGSFELQVACVLLAAVTTLAGSLSWAFQVTSESVVVLRGVGVLLVSQQRWGGSSSRFLDGQDIHSVFIHETLTTTNIHTHLAFILYSKDSLALAFPHLSPGQGLLVPIYRQLHQLLNMEGMARAQRVPEVLPQQ